MFALLVVEVPSGKIGKRIDLAAGHADGVTTTDGESLVVRSMWEPAAVYDLGAGKEAKPFKGGEKFLLRDVPLKDQLDTEEGKKRRQNLTEPHAYLAHGGRLLTMRHGGEIQMWDVAMRQRLWKNEYASTISYLSFSPDGNSW